MIFFRTSKPTLAGYLKFPQISLHGFCKTVNVMPKNEVKTSKDRRHLLYLATNCKEIVSVNTKEHIKLVICGATVFLLF